MNYYRRFPGDYARDTQHLNVAEHGIYNLLLDHLYATQKPIATREMAYRICKIPQKANGFLFGEFEKANGLVSEQQVDSILDQFFFLRKNGFSNRRYENELKHMKSKSKKATDSGKRGGRPKKSERFPNENRSLISSFPEKKRKKAIPDSRYQSPEPESLNPKFSQDAAVVAITRDQAEETAAAFSAIGFTEPFGQKTFQEVWLRRFRSRDGDWLTQVMEATIQECQQRNIGIPPPFYEAKHAVEKDENAQFKDLHRRVPL